ncbi:MAG: family oxidoreductase [Cyanobacteria bacterium RYN_339]|nr:family oxidoreductase [Cyanobacteria bacterium RYN_339]
MTLASLKGKTALVTGASSGLGADFARHLAAAGCHLVLTARREAQLQAMKDELTAAHGVEVLLVPQDLSAPDAPEKLLAAITAAGKQVDVLINNAGYGAYGQFLEIPWEKEHQMLELDIVALVHLTKLFAAPMVARGQGYILQVASIGAFQPSPLYASYSAAKAFVLSYGNAINYELRGTGVSCTVLSPGVTATEFLQVSGQKPTTYQRLMMMTSPEVTRAGLEAMVRRRMGIVPGFLNRLMAVSGKASPAWLATMLAYRVMKQP